MNESIDLTKVLKDCPKGWKFWSPLFGEVEFVRHCKSMGFFNVRPVGNETEEWSFTYKATIFLGTIESKEIMIYPSKDQRDWQKFTAPWYKREKFDPKDLKPLDGILVKNNGVWFLMFFKSYRETDKGCICCSFGVYDRCIPYNANTKHLIGTSDEAPEYYRYWDK